MAVFGDEVPADEGLHRGALAAQAVKAGHVAFGEQLVLFAGPRFFRVEDDDVRVEADFEGALAAPESEDLRRIVVHHLRDERRRQFLLMHGHVEHHRQEILDRVEPAPGVPDVLRRVVLFFVRSRGVVAADAGEGPVEDVIPKAVHRVLGAQRRGAFGRAALFEHEIFIEAEVVGAGFRRDGKAFVLSVLDHLGHHRVRHVADVHPGAGRPGHVDDVLRRNVFRPDVVGVEEIADLLFTGLIRLGLRFFFTFQDLAVFFAVETADRAGGLQDFQGLSDVAEVDRREQRPVGAGEALEGRDAAGFEIEEIGHVILHGVWLVVEIADQAAPEAVIHVGMAGNLAHL